jgi:hypothetical protein
MITNDAQISDAYTVTTSMLCKAAGMGRTTLWKHETKYGNLGQHQKRPGVREKLWTPSQANKFLKRIGKPEAF